MMIVSLNKKLIRIISLALFAVVVLAAGTYAKLIEISVEVAEINTNKAQELGIRWIDNISGEVGKMGAGEVAYTSGDRKPEYLPELPSLFEIGEIKRYNAFAADINLMVEEGAAEITSNPKLVTESGSEASFSAGGEFPVVSGGLDGQIEWKEYGVRMRMVPVLKADNNIELDIEVDVSELDWTNAVGNMPALTKRGAKSNVTLKSGETLTIAGLKKTNKSEQVVGIPLLKDIPLLGYLFSKHKTVSTNRTVMIFITPRILDRIE